MQDEGARAGLHRFFARAMVTSPSKAYRVLFHLAAAYNLAFGLWAMIFPGQFFALFHLQPLPYPSLWSCLGMVVGLYGILYGWVAEHQAEGGWIIAVGLLGKILGPLGWLDAVRRGELPSRTFPLILCNDLVWYFPFLFYLLRNSRRRPLWIVGLIVGFHGLACLGLAFLMPAMDFNPDFQARQQFLQAHHFGWVFVWALWVLSSLSFAAFATCWVQALRRRGLPAWLWWFLAMSVAGVLFDLSGEAVYIAWLPETTRTLAEFQRGIHYYNWASAGCANGLYCLAGLGLSWISYRSGFLRGWLSSWGFVMWVVGFSLTLFAFLHLLWPMVISAMATMALFIPWAGYLGWRYLWQESSS